MKILFLGFHHKPNSARLFHRQMRALKKNLKGVELYYLTFEGIKNLTDCFDQDGNVIKLPKSEDVRFLSMLKKIMMMLSYIPQLKKMKFNIIQASDVREIIWAIIFKVFIVHVKIIFDSHEDFYNQVYDYSGKTIRAYLKANYFLMLEIFFIRFFTVVYCTDDYLKKKYEKKIYNAKAVELLRNFPYKNYKLNKKEYTNKPVLDLVYIGGVNKYRGLFECAKYLSAFNSKHAPIKKLTLTIYSNYNPIIMEIKKFDSHIKHLDPIDYKDLIEVLPNYDIGICLWLKLKKFERNLPLKNFDYMSVGLPIITSNFGNLQKYAMASGGAICINPLEFEEFESAVLKMFNPEFRKKLSNNSLNYIQQKASFDDESKVYMKYISS